LTVYIEFAWKSVSPLLSVKARAAPLA
jgi:hypothetical protein